MGKADNNAVLAAYARSYVKAQYTWVQMLTEHLTDCSRVFRGDLQAMLILAIIGQSYLFQMMKEGHEAYEPGTTPPLLDGVSINASSLAAVLEIPRETVRRKLALLEKQGWVEKGNDGWRLVVDHAGTAARADLHDLDRRSILRFAKLVGDFNLLASKAGS